MSTLLRSVADMKRAMTPGAVLIFDNLNVPHLSGQRTVLRAQTQKVCMTFPPGHPNLIDPIKARAGSWLTFPKAAEVRFDGGTATLLREDGTPWLRITVP